MTYSIGKTFAFEAAHSLPQLEEGHKCRRVHGHNYRVELVVAGRLDRKGFVIDFANLKPFAELLDSEWDHRNLNDVVSFDPTAERLAHYLYERARGLFPDLIVVEVTVWETDDSWATYSG